MKTILKTTSISIGRAIHHFFTAEVGRPTKHNPMPSDAAHSAVHAAIPELVKSTYLRSEHHLSGHRIVIGFETLDDACALHRAIATLIGDARRAARAGAPK